MTPYADFMFFAMMLYPLIPTVILGLCGRANRWWTLFITVVVIAVQYWLSDDIPLTSKWVVSALWVVCGYLAYQGTVTWAFLRWKSRPTFYAAMVASILPLALTKFVPLFAPDNAFGFLGISYVCFRALDVIFSIHDGVVTAVKPLQYVAFLFFFPTVSSGPIDRYRRFAQDWAKTRGHAEFLDDLDAAVQRVFQGFLYKFIIAALIKVHWVDRVASSPHVGPIIGYMYAYTLYLFFDFAGYSAFAIGFSRIFGIRTPENFDRPFLSKNIRDFWNRWHISLSFWFRDHIYMRFLLAAGKGKWFKSKHTASYLGLYLTFGIMGVWHGPEWHYILYGLYHATLLSGYDAFARWNKQRKFWPDGRWWRIANIVLTFHAFAFGLLIFSGRLSPPVPPRRDEVADQIDCYRVNGWAWDRDKGDVPLHVDVYIDDAYVGRVLADQFLQDLKDRGYGSGNHGFTFKMPPYIHDGRSHNIEVRVTESGRVLRGTPASVSCPRP
ncbi:MAG TPA: D-alanyl-lipoteichoic acid biosynthesis protein DltB [Chthoniobacteraceae bacterium]